MPNTVRGRSRRWKGIVGCLMLAVLAGALRPAPVWGAKSPLRRAEADSLYRLGEQAWQKGEADRAEDLYTQALEANRKHARAHCGLGYLYLEQGRVKQAREAFRRAQKYDRRLPEAYNGLGLVYAREKGQWMRAIDYFSRALGERPGYVEALFNIGMTHLNLLNRDGIKAFEQVVEMAPNHPDAYYRLGYLHEFDTLQKDKAAVYYEKQLEVNPAHQEAMWRLGQLYREKARMDKAAQTLTRLMMSDQAYQRGYMLELAEVYLEQGDFKRAETLFETYLADLSSQEREPYEDIAPVAPPEVQEAYPQSSGEARRAFVERFWKRRDPTPITDVNERRVEHYRRVAYALEHYGKGVQPWDRRGEVYVRFGEPNHRSASGARRWEVGPAVRGVKQRLLDRADEAVKELLNDYAAVDSDSMNVTYRGTGEERARRQYARRARRLRIPIREEQQQRESVRKRAEVEMASSGLLVFLGRPIFPIKDRRAWEYWIYTSVAGGTEIVFRQMPGAPDGVFDYAVLPAGMSARSRLFWEPLQPAVVMREVPAEVYVPSFLAHPLRFAAYPATFQGRGDSTRVEVYYGFPASEFAENGEKVRVQRGAVLYNAEGDPVYRAVGQAVFRTNGEASKGVIPDVVAMEVAPGSYYLAVQAVEEETGRTQVYGMPLRVPAYGGGRLRLSDVELAASILPASSPDAFVKQDLRVVPLATRYYPRKLHVSIYYEVYGLTRDAFGQTDYQVAYTIRPVEEKNFGAKVLGGLGKLVGVEKGDEGVTISYDQDGSAGDVASYLAVDMAGSEPGEYVIEVAVTDRGSGQEVSKTAAFKLE